MKPELTLCRPDRTEIVILNEAYGENFEMQLGELSLLTFKIPFKLTIRQQLKDNPNAKLIRERYLIKYKLRNTVEYLVITKIVKNHNDNVDELQIDCVGQASQLQKRNIVNYSAVSKNATQLLNDVLNITSWSVGSIDGVYNTAYRSLEFSGSIFEAVVAIAETYEALLIFDSLNKSVNLYKPKEYGINKGFNVSYGKLLNNITYESDSSEQATRLVVRGKDGISINAVTSTGSSYLENYSYYLNDMSTGLRNAVIAWTNLKNSNESVFNGYLSSLASLNSTLSTKESELSDLKTQLEVILDTLDVKNSQSEDVTSTIAQKTAKEAQISSKQSEINTINASINNVLDDIEDFSSLLSIENNLTSLQIIELDEFIYESEYSNDFISDPQKLKEMAIDHFNDILEPKIIIDIDIVNLYEVLELEDSPDLDRIVLGDIINIEYELSNIKTQARITGISIDFESGDINLTISNLPKNITSEDKWVKQLYTAVGSAGTFAANKYAYDNAIVRTDEASQILNSTWNAIDRQIEGGLNNSVSITRRGIITSDIADPQRMTIVQNSVIGLSKNGGLNWQTALTPDGLIAESLKGNIVITNNLLLSNQSGSFIVNELGAIISDLDLIVTRSDTKSRTLINATDGLKLQKNTGTTGSPVWSDQIGLDNDGNSIFKGYLSVGSGNSIFKADLNGIYLGHSTFASAPFSVDLNGIVKASNVNLTGGSMGWGNFSVNSAGVITASGANISGNVTANSIVAGTTITAPNIVGGNITGGSITSNTNINVTSDLRVGNNIYLQNQGFFSSKIEFNDICYIRGNTDSEISLIAFGGVYANGYRIDQPQVAVFG